MRATQGYHLQHLLQMRLGPGEAVSGKVFETGTAEVYETQPAVSAAMSNMTYANRTLFQKATVGLDKPLSALCVPLTVRDKKIGVLTLQNLRQVGVFSYADLAFLQLIADLIALSVENARLVEELQGLQAFFWEESEVNKNPNRIMVRSFNEVWEVSEKENVPLRIAAYLLAVSRVADSVRERGVFP